MSKIFISHATADDPFVRTLQQAIDAQLDAPAAWIDSRELRAGDILWPQIKAAIEKAAAFIVVFSEHTPKSKWVGKELKLALEHQAAQKAAADFPVIPLLLDLKDLGLAEAFFQDEPAFIRLDTVTLGIEGAIAAAMDAILVALGKRAPTDQGQVVQPTAEPVEELVLELSHLGFHTDEIGRRRATAEARLVYQPADSSIRAVASKPWKFTDPLGLYITNELQWYLEESFVWPVATPTILERIARIETSFRQWGTDLHAAALPLVQTEKVTQAWAKTAVKTSRRFSVHVDASTLEGASAEEVATAREAAAELLRLPWELLHDGKVHVFQGAKPVRVRRRVPNTDSTDPMPPVRLPIRILLVTARPESQGCDYIDHRASALPLVQAMEALPGLVKLHLLPQPTFSALRVELERASRAGHPYHVVHFDGHGVYHPQIGLGGLCFEDPEDMTKLRQRRPVTVFTGDLPAEYQDKKGYKGGLAAMLHAYRIPLVFLEACQSGESGPANESVATALLQGGVGSVVAMTHSVLVETARRFVEAFYKALAEGKRVGDAMLAGQTCLHEDSRRGKKLDGTDFRLQDWFVPVLYQEQADPQLFTQPATRPQTLADAHKDLVHRLGETLPEPETGFIGRSRELLDLQRLLLPGPGHALDPLCPPPADSARFAVITGQGGEGKTTLAAEFARWVLRSQQLRRVAFVSVERYGHLDAVIDAIGRQLVGATYSRAAHADVEAALHPIEKILREQPTLIVLDNLESILEPPWELEDASAKDSALSALADDSRRQGQAILDLATRLSRHGQTRLLFTSREALPAPYQRHLPLEQLDTRDAVRLVEAALQSEQAVSPGASYQEHQEDIAELVRAVHGHARTLALLGPSLRALGVQATRAQLTDLMADLERRHPGQREKSLFASVQLSLRRLSPANQQRVQALSVFHGGVQLGVLQKLMAWQKDEVADLARDLLATGLATLNPYNHLSLNAALCPWLRLQSEAGGQARVSASLSERCVAEMRRYVDFLVQQQSRDAQVAVTLPLLELPNLLALLDRLQQAEDAEATLDLTTSLFSLLQNLGKPRLLQRISQVRDDAAKTLGSTWSHAAFEAIRTRTEQQLASDQFQAAFEAAQSLLTRAQQAGPAAYDEADYDLALAHWLLARVLRTLGGSEQALPLLETARQGFEAIAHQRQNPAAAGMASACHTERGTCLRTLGRLDEAATAYEERIRGAEAQKDRRGAAVARGQLGTVRLDQRRYAEALAAYQQAKTTFTTLGEAGSVATVWHQIGMVHEEAGDDSAAEHAYRESLAINVREGNLAGQASTLNQLGTLFGNQLNRPEEAVAFYQRAADLYAQLGNQAKEGFAQNNLANTLRKLRRLEEAHAAILRAIKCDSSFGHASEPWKSWASRADIETDQSQPEAAATSHRRARDLYLAYRRAGGENHSGSGRLAHDITQMLASGKAAQAQALLQQLSAEPKVAFLHPFVQALTALLTGSRDPALAEAPGLRYTESAEMLLLLERLG